MYYKLVNLAVEIGPTRIHFMCPERSFTQTPGPEQQEGLAETTPWIPMMWAQMWLFGAMPQTRVDREAGPHAGAELGSA